MTAIAHTTSPRSSRFEVIVKTGFLRAGVFDAQNIVTILQLHLFHLWQPQTFPEERASGGFIGSVTVLIHTVQSFTE